MYRARRPVWILFILASHLCFFPVAQAQDSGEEAERRQELTRTQEKMAELYEAKDDLKNAWQIWQELLADEPLNAKYLFNASRLAAALKKYQAALLPAQKLIDIDSDKLEYRDNLASILVALNRYGEALPHLEWLVHRKPQDIELRRDLAAAYEMQKRPADALKQYHWLVVRFPQNTEYRLTRAQLYGDLNQDEKQIDELEAVLKILPPEKKVEAHRQLAMLYESQEDWSQAEDHWQRLLKQQPQDAQGPVALARIRQARTISNQQQWEEKQENERYQDWLMDIYARGDDF